MGIHGDKNQQERDWVLNGGSLERFGTSLRFESKFRL